MPLPTLTRGIYWRDDFQTIAWATGSGVTATTDGDILSLSGMTSSQGYATGGALGFTPFSTSTYPFTLIRGTGPGTIDFKAFYSDSTSQTFTLNLTSSFQVFTSALTTGKTLNTFSLVNPSVAGTYQFDFCYFFKETLILPSVFEPLRPIKTRRVAVLPILGREGGILQDLGSVETDLSISGGLFPTSQYTADQWWHVFDGLVLEAGVFQSDGNETWQWLSSDLVNGKFFIMSWVPAQVMGRIAYHDYVLSLKRFDVIGETASMIGAIQ